MRGRSVSDGQRRAEQAYTEESISFMSKIIDASGLGHPTCGYLPDGALRGRPTLRGSALS